jgi:hypothetical protein
MVFDRKHNGSEVAGPEVAASAAASDADPQLTSRRNRLAGMWAAELLGLIGQTAHDYARELAHAHENTPDEHVIRRLARDLHGRVTAHEIREKLSHLLGEAKRQLLNGDRNRE